MPCFTIAAFTPPHGSDEQESYRLYRRHQFNSLPDDKADVHLQHPYIFHRWVFPKRSCYS
jgi:hypothetical protein